MSDSEPVDLGAGFVVRRAVAADVAELDRLEREARAALVDVRGGQPLLTELAPVGDWAAAIDQPDRAVWVASVDGIAVGYLELSLPDATGTAHVRQVHVHAEARELGFGDELIARATEATVSAGGTVIEGWALPGDRDTKNLFERAGITARKLIVSKRLR